MDDYHDKINIFGGKKMTKQMAVATNSWYNLEIIKNLLKGINHIIVLLPAFLIWQVTNHRPDEFDKINQGIDSYV